MVFLSLSLALSLSLSLCLCRAIVSWSAHRIFLLHGFGGTRRWCGALWAARRAAHTCAVISLGCSCNRLRRLRLVSCGLARVCQQTSPAVALAGLAGGFNFRPGAGDSA